MKKYLDQTGLGLLWQQIVNRFASKAGIRELVEEIAGAGFYVPTLLSAPTSSTLTYDEDGETKDFIIGSLARVADQTSPNGYIFYQLYDITGSGANKSAVWGVLGTEGDAASERLIINLTSNQGAVDPDLVGATVVVKDDNDYVIYNGTWAGTPITVNIPPATQYSITVGNVTDYQAPAVQSYLALIGNVRSTTFVYNTELVTVQCTTEDSASCAGKTIKINNKTLTLDNNGSVTTKMAHGTDYTVYLGSFPGYISSSSTITPSSASKTVSMQWKTLKLGVFIEDINGSVYERAVWNNVVHAQANSIVIISSSCSMRLAITEFNGTKQIHKNSTDPIENYLTQKSEADAKVYYDGAGDTSKIIQFNAAYGTNEDTYAAPWCRAFTFPDGTTKGDLPSLGQLWLAYQNKTEVNACLTACGGTAMNTSTYYWTSTFYGVSGSNRRCWLLNWSNGSVNYVNNYNRVRPVAAYV